MYKSRKVAMTRLSIILLLISTILGFLLVPTNQSHGCNPENLTCPIYEPDGIYYVTPTPPPNLDCPSNKSCQLFMCYRSCRVVGINSTLLFLPGIHHGIATQDLDAHEVYYIFSMIGIGPASDVILHSVSSIVYFFINTIEQVTLENLTIYGSEIMIQANLRIVRCLFNVSSVLVSSQKIVNVEDSGFYNSLSTALTLYVSGLILHGNVEFINNTGTYGGALALVEGSSLGIAGNTTVHFRNNKAFAYGGAVYVNDDPKLLNDNLLKLRDFHSLCFYRLLDFDLAFKCVGYSIKFINNSARLSGDHIFGASLKAHCIASFTPYSNIPNYILSIYSFYRWRYFFEFSPGFNSTLSAVASHPSRVCICGNEFMHMSPQCTNSSKIVGFNISVYPGEVFTIPVVVVGGDFGTTLGTVYANIHAPESNNRQHVLSHLGSQTMYSQVVSNNSRCTELEFSVLSNTTGVRIKLSLTTSPDNPNVVWNLSNISDLCDDYHTYGVIAPALISTPVLVHVTLNPCQLGFTLTGGRCDCFQTLLDKNVKCILTNKKGYISWNSSIWINGIINENRSNGFILGDHCPVHNCKNGNKSVDLQLDPDAQCAFNHSGRLCGGCRQGLSLAIGSSHCIHCLNDNNLALIIFFAAAGFLLVFFISALNLTVTQGMINGLIFYSNVIWAYQGILFPQDIHSAIAFHKTFIAWINLDFGIETCLFKGLDAYWKTWLQFVFPIYTWVICGLFILAARLSARLTRLFGNRSVHTLSTLFFLAYTKLLQTIIMAIGLAELVTYPEKSKQIVWAKDGNFMYGHFPHIFLLLAAIGCLLLLWLPYTLILFSMQWLRRIDCCRVIARFKPVYDAYFAPLKERHHYWFGLLLLVRGMLLTVSSLTLSLIPALSLFLLLAIAIFLLCYLNYKRVYKRKAITLLESLFILNLILFAVGVLCIKDNEAGLGQTILFGVSVTMAFLTFCGIVLWSLIPRRLVEKIGKHVSISEQPEDEDEHIWYRDSILEDIQNPHTRNTYGTF